jgi:hypothetical protein
MTKHILTVALLLAVTAPAVAEKMPIGTNFWDISWHRADDVFINGHNNVTGDDPWNPEFLRQLEPYAVLRFMDWGKVNNAERTSFDQRKQKDNPDQSPEVAYEWMIDLCNRMQADLWICIPHRADEEYARQFAELIKAELDSDLKVYVEYSNETWNGMFKQHQHAIDRGTELNLPGQGMEPGENPWYVGWAYHVYAAVRHFKHFDDVFADEPDRLVKVLAGQNGNVAVLRHHLAVLDDPAVNPNGIKIDAYALAPYFGHQVDGGAADVFEQLRADLRDRVVPNVAKHAAELEGTGLDLIAYEGGQHLLDNAVTANEQQAMHAMYGEYLDAMDDYFTGVFAHYVHVGTNPPRHMWGSLRYTGQDPKDAPKYRALLDYVGKD